MCKLLTAFVVLVSVTALTSAALEPRIIGGSSTDISKHSHLVSIRSKLSAGSSDSAYWHKCAGFIYTTNVVVTSAQCLINLQAGEHVMVVAGANTRTGTDGMMYPVAKWVAHPDFSWQLTDYDVGIIIIADVFDLTHTHIATATIKQNRPAVGKFGTVAGWGYREENGPSSYLLEETQVPILSAAQCQEAYKYDEVTERMICAGYLTTGGKDACQGDTGGPLMLENEVVGLVSWGWGCGRPGYPSVYTFVASVKDWIDATIVANT